VKPASAGAFDVLFTIGLAVKGVAKSSSSAPS
jgi:hypothetical protein